MHLWRRKLELFAQKCHNDDMYVDHQGKTAGRLLHNFIIILVIAGIGVCIYFVYDKVQNGLFNNERIENNVCNNEDGVKTMEKSGIDGATKCEPVEKEDARSKIKSVYGK